MILRIKTLWLVLLAILVLTLAGCNDTLRQFITPIPSPGGDPSGLSHAVIVSRNPPINSVPQPGSDLHIDVSGDSVAAVVPLGVDPNFIGKSSNRVFALNGDGTVTSYLALLPLGSSPAITTLPAGAVGVAGAASPASNFYMANPAQNNLNVIGPAPIAVTGTIVAGTDPVAVVAGANSGKVYVLNRGSDSITVLSSTDNANLATIQLPPGAGPVWGVLSGDGANVFVVNQGNNTVSVIDSLTDTVVATVSTGTSPNYAFYENRFKRVFVSNTGSNNITVIKADGIQVNVPSQILPATNVPVSGTPTQVAAIPDGTRAYAALGNCPAGINHLTIADTVVGGGCTGNLVSVIDLNALIERKTITVGPGAVSIDAAANGSRVYVISAHDITTITDNVSAKNGLTPQPPRTVNTPSVSIIDTRTDSVLRSPVDVSVTTAVPTLHTPQQVASCAPVIDPNFNNVVPIPCAGQIPFQVRIFP